MSDPVQVGPGRPCSYCGGEYGEHSPDCPVTRDLTRITTSEARLRKALLDLVKEVAKAEGWLKHTKAFEAAAKEVGYEE